MLFLAKIVSMIFKINFKLSLKNLFFWFLCEVQLNDRILKIKKGQNMINEKKSLKAIEDFESHYNYDASNMHEMLKENPKAYATFEAFMPMSGFVDKAPKDVIYVAKLTSIKNEDCGTCVQLNVDMAIEAGVDKEIIKEIIFNEGKGLAPELKFIYDFTLLVGNKKEISISMYEKLDKMYGRNVLIEIALAISASKVFPTIKRVLNYMTSCSKVQIKVK